MAAQQVGILTQQIIDILNIKNLDVDSPIMLGESNIKHMQVAHPDDYAKYGKSLNDILKSPDYVGINSKDNSIEYVKEFKINNDYVKVAVRVSVKGTLFARSLYILNKKRVINFIRKGTLKKI